MSNNKAETRQKKLESWQNRLQKKYHITATLTEEDYETFNSIVKKSAVPILIGGIISSILFAIFLPRENFSDTFMFIIAIILGAIPGVFAAAPFAAIVYKIAEKKIVPKFRDVLETRETQKLQAQAAQKQRIEEDRLQKLTKLVRVSKSLQIGQMATILGMEETELYDKIIDWADKFGFVLDQFVVEFTGTQKEAFIEELEREFSQWEAKGSAGKV